VEDTFGAGDQLAAIPSEATGMLKIVSIWVSDPPAPML
jgi:hypothetical protein